MKFRTETEIGKLQIPLEHSDRVITIGPCFSDEISRRFRRYRFQLLSNPFGIVYNPLSILRSAGILTGGNIYTAENLLLHNGIYHSIDHHGSFSHPDPERSLEAINSMLKRAVEFLPGARWCILTLGTAWYFRMRETGNVAANCHKIPADSFVRLRMNTGEASSAILRTIDIFREINKNLNFIIAVSPVRHWRDGFIDNTRSKAVLHLASEEICRSRENCFYFPSYELLMDDLRDYRFYREDLIHPNEIAVNYIWEVFTGNWFSRAALESMEETGNVVRMMEHRPLYPESSEFRRFSGKTRELFDDLKMKYPFLDLEEDLKADMNSTN